jgi:protein arginine kinase activator
MKCDFCDKKATVFLTQLVEGQMKKVCLCDAAPRSAASPIPPDSRSRICCSAASAAGKETRPPRRENPDRRGRPQVPDLRLHLDDLRRVRRFGCSDCYSTFAEEVANAARHAQGHLAHRQGARGLDGPQVLHQRLEELRARLDQAIASESYEEAAGIRDEIRNLELANP